MMLLGMNFRKWSALRMMSLPMILSCLLRTENQWLQVRTGSFKRWFGDWEQADKYDYLLSESWVSELDGNEFQKDGTPLTKK
ncbi:MAG: hypothetical protein LBH34_00095 [Prevotellaceae bacterium]|jgi:hypothetical protein|nr:hypothetical protein [Prevotellaceae bacterium]